MLRETDESKPRSDAAPPRTWKLLLEGYSQARAAKKSKINRVKRHQKRPEDSGGTNRPGANNVCDDLNAVRIVTVKYFDDNAEWGVCDSVARRSASGRAYSYCSLCRAQWKLVVGRSS